MSKSKSKSKSKFADLTPIEQDDGDHPICPIAYTQEYRELSGLMRALMSANEISERALELSAQLLEQNAAHYTAWTYRKQLVIGLQVDVEAELEWVAELAAQNPKNYQLWHHRQALLPLLVDPRRAETEDERMQHRALREELKFLDLIIDDDSKNFHAWSHRQWVVSTYGLWRQEMVYVEVQINQDVRNNSAWNQRYFVVRQGGGSPAVGIDTDTDTDTDIDGEISYAKDKICLAPNNESPWAYVVGLLIRHDKDALCTKLLPAIQQLAEGGVYGEAVRATAFYWATLVDVYEYSNDSGLKELAEEACGLLEQQYDQTRAKYWQFRRQQLIYSAQ